MKNQTRKKLKVLKSFSLDITEKFSLSRDPETYLTNVPGFIQELLSESGVATLNQGAIVGRDSYFEQTKDLGQPFSEKQLSKDGVGNTRIVSNCSLQWRWVDPRGGYEGGEVLRAGALQWVPEAIAMAALKVGGAELLAWPMSPSPNLKLKKEIVQLGSFLHPRFVNESEAA